MALTNDILLGGNAYNVVPGTYKKRSAPATAAVNPRDVRRLVLGPFQRGQRQALTPPLDLAAGKPTAGWDSAGVGPACDGQGVEPFPNSTTQADGNLVDTPATTLRGYGAVAGANAFIGLGRRIYKSVSLTTSAWANLTAAADLGAGFTITGLAYYQDDLLVLLGNGTDTRKFNTSTNALSVWRSGEKATLGVGYQGQLIYAPLAANNQEELRLSGTKWNGNAITHLRYLDAPIVAMALFAGKVAIVTKTSLFLMGGQPYPGEQDDASVPADTSKAPLWLGDPEPVMTHGGFAEGDDFTFLCSYRGRLYTWLGGRVAEFDDSQEQGRWQRVGPEGSVCYGGTVAGDWLTVVIQGRYGNREIWAFDGLGWWLIFSSGSGNPIRLWPCPLSGAGNRDVLVFRDGATTYELFRLKWRAASTHTYATAGTWTSSLIDAGDPTRDKAWRAVGATFAAPAQRGLTGSSDSVTITLEYSTDDGVSWTSAASVSSGSSAVLNRVLQSAFSTIPVSRHLQVRVSWSSVLEWAPVLVNVWAEYESLDNAPGRRRWELVVDAGDRRVQRDGQLSGQTGRQAIDALWSAWASGSILVFKDVDNDANAVDVQVRIEEIEEKAAKPADGARWGQSTVALTLAQV